VRGGIFQKNYISELEKKKKKEEEVVHYFPSFLIYEK
jgi:hypothetical protein